MRNSQKHDMLSRQSILSHWNRQFRCKRMIRRLSMTSETKRTTGTGPKTGHCQKEILRRHLAAQKVVAANNFKNFLECDAVKK